MRIESQDRRPSGLTVSLVFSKRCPFFHQVMLAGGLDPED